MPRIIVGRTSELEALQQRLARARQGERQVIFLAGEAGIGKTTVVQSFLARVSTQQGVWIGHGTCDELSGSGEAYRPVLEALERLGRGAERSELVTLLLQYAPTWLVQMPSLLRDETYATLPQYAQGESPERMVRELTRAVEELPAGRMLILCLEDLQWSDPSTVGLLEGLARRQEYAARLLVVGTYRPADVHRSDHLLKAMQYALQAHEQCEERALGLLTEEDVREYLATRFPHSQLSPAVARVLSQHTEGHPLFMVHVVNDWIAQRVLAEHEGQWTLTVPLDTVQMAIPRGVLALFEQQIGRLTPGEQRVLEAASAASGEFSAAAVAAALNIDVLQVEDICDALLHHHAFLHATPRRLGNERRLAARYRLQHDLYRRALDQRLSLARRCQLHQRLGEWKKGAYGARAHEIAAELAIHFEYGGDYQQAVHYREAAAENAMRKYAYREAIEHLSKALALLSSFPETPERTQHEIALHLALGNPLMATKGFAAPEVAQTYLRVRDLCQATEATPQRFFALLGLWSYHLVRAEVQVAHDVSTQLLELVDTAPALNDTRFRLPAYLALGTSWYYRGVLARAHTTLAQGYALYDSASHRPQVSEAVQDPGVHCLAFVALTQWLQGYPDQALQTSQHALTLAHQVAHPYTVAFALSVAVQMHQFRQEAPAAQSLGHQLLRLADEQGFPLWWAQGAILHGWALITQGVSKGVEQLEGGMRAYQNTGAMLERPYYLAMVGEAYRQSGHADMGVPLIDEALARVAYTEERWWEPELHRLRGELLCTQHAHETRTQEHRHNIQEAEQCFQQALDLAHSQGAKSLELRAGMSLSRLWQQQGKRSAARKVLEEIYNWFTEGFDTADLQEARVLLEALT